MYTTPVLTKPSVSYEIGVLWDNITHVILQICAFGSKQIWIRSFKWGTVHSCWSRGCKDIWGQRWRSQRKLLLPLIFLQPINLQGCTVPYLKDVTHICLEPEAQGCALTFNKFYVGSKYPYFISYRGKRLYLFCCGCISLNTEVLVPFVSLSTV